MRIQKRYSKSNCKEGSIIYREEKRGIGTNELSISETKTIVPILTKSEMERDTTVTLVCKYNDN